MFLRDEPAATVAVPIDRNDTIHAASLLYAHTEMPLRFYFVTSIDSEKCSLLNSVKSISCACVIGTAKGTAFTLQMRGSLRTVDHTQFADLIEGYYAKRGNRADDINDSQNILLQFTPEWARFTDYAKGYDHQYLKLQ